MSTDAMFLAVRVCATAGLLLLVLAGCVHLIRRGGAARPVAPVAARYPYFPCHSGVCAHMSTQHVLTPIGHVCRNCGTPRTEAPSA